MNPRSLYSLVMCASTLQCTSLFPSPKVFSFLGCVFFLVRWVSGMQSREDAGGVDV